MGVMTIASEAYPDTIEFGRKGKMIKPNPDPENPIWCMVDVRYKRKLRRNITLRELKTHPNLDGFQLLKRGNRLSVVPVSKEHWDFILALE